MRNKANKLMRFLMENKNEIIGVIGLFLIFLFLAPIIVGHQGHPIIDSGRLAYVQSEILRGKLLYKDIIEIMAPLSFQFECVLL